MGWLLMNDRRRYVRYGSGRNNYRDCVDCLARPPGVNDYRTGLYFLPNYGLRAAFANRRRFFAAAMILPYLHC